MRLSTGSGVAGVSLPCVPGRPPLEEREAVRVEQAAAVGRKVQRLVLHPTVDGPEGRQQPGPGVLPALEHLLAAPVGFLPELAA